MFSLSYIATITDNQDYCNGQLYQARPRPLRTGSLRRSLLQHSVSIDDTLSSAESMIRLHECKQPASRPVSLDVGIAMKSGKKQCKSVNFF